jgi:hypothetical protein
MRGQDLYRPDVVAIASEALLAGLPVARKGLRPVEKRLIARKVWKKVPATVIAEALGLSLRTLYRYTATEKRAYRSGK